MYVVDSSGMYVMTVKWHEFWFHMGSQIQFVSLTHGSKLRNTNRSGFEWHET
jgi:hypothetical protein